MVVTIIVIPVSVSISISVGIEVRIIAILSHVRVKILVARWLQTNFDTS